MLIKHIQFRFVLKEEHVHDDEMLIRVKKVIIQKGFLISLFTLLQHVLSIAMLMLN